MKYLSILFLLIGLKSFSQNLTCSDFKVGTFHIDVTTESVKVIRNENTQIEIWEGSKESMPLGVRETSYETIEWIDECSFRLKYDGTKMELTEVEKFCNDNNGILVELKTVEGNCYDYVATFVFLDNPPIVQNLKICKR